MKEKLSFIKEAVKKFNQTGAVLPSSRWLAKAMVPDLDNDRDDIHIVEIGAGTGPFTREIITRLNPDDRLTVCEINERFIPRLTELLDGKDLNSRILNCDVRTLAGKIETSADYVISGLPFNNFEVNKLKEVFSTIKNITGNRGRFIYFEYYMIGKIKALLPGNKAFKMNRDFMQSLKRNYLVNRKKVFRNLPPAVVNHLDLSRKN